VSTQPLVLVADDEPTLVATLKYNLERESYGVITATDGESALAEPRRGLARRQPVQCEGERRHATVHRW